MNKEGDVLKSWMETNRYNAPQLAKLIGVQKEAVYYQLKQEKVSDSFKHKLSTKKLNVFGLSTSGSLSNGKELDLSELQIMMVPLVNKHAYGGYLRGFGDPEYISQLPEIPFSVDREYKGTYMAFEVSGDSMDVEAKKYYKTGDIVLARQIDKIHWRDKLHIKKWSFVIVHKTEGIIIKDIKDHDVKNGILTLHSLNPFYEDFDVSLNDVMQIYNVVKVLREE